MVGINENPYDQNGTADVGARASETDAGANRGELIIGGSTYGIPRSERQKMESRYLFEM